MIQDEFEKRLKAFFPSNDGRKTEKILCACSGGADSTALLHLLRRTEGAGVVCAHFNHCLRGAESDRDETFVRTLCGEMGVEFHAGRGDVAAYAAEHRLGTEEAARELRYAFLERTARETGCGYIATAHTADDNAETVLMNLIRGAGTRGLSGIPPARESGTGVKIIRPLLRVTRAEIEAYLAENRLSHVEDSTNESDDYTRNRLRHSVLPLLRELNPSAAEHICAAAALLREDEEYLDGMASAFLDTHFRDGALPLGPLAALPRPIAMRVLRRFCGNPGREHLGRAYALCREGREHASLDLPGGCVTREGGFLRFGPRETAETAIPRRELRAGETVPLPEIGTSVRRTEVIFSADKEIYSSFNTFYFQSEKICGKISVASRAPGDRIRLAGRGCTKEVRKLFSERGLPLAARARTPVFSDEAGVIAVPGFGVAERCAPTFGKKAVKIEMISDLTEKEREKEGHHDG